MKMGFSVVGLHHDDAPPALCADCHRRVAYLALSNLREFQVIGEPLQGTDVD